MVKKKNQDIDFIASRRIQKKLASKHLFSSSSAPWQQKIIREFLSFKKLSSNIKCLDAGCGVGNNIRTLLQFSNSIYAIDKSQRAIEFTKNRYKNNLSSIKLFLGQLENMPFPSNMFDFILCTEVLEHVPNINLTIKEVCRVLKPQGRVIFSFQNYLNPSMFVKLITERLTKKNWDAWGTHNHPKGHEHYLTYFKVRKDLLQNKNMKIITIRGADYLNGWLCWIPWIRKNYNLLDNMPFLSVGRLPLIKIMGMDCFILAEKVNYGVILPRSSAAGRVH